MKIAVSKSEPNEQITTCATSEPICQKTAMAQSKTDHLNTSYRKIESTKGIIAAYRNESMILLGRDPDQQTPPLGRVSSVWRSL